MGTNGQRRLVLPSLRALFLRSYSLRHLPLALFSRLAPLLSRTCSAAVLWTCCAAASRTSSTKTPSCRLRREQVNNLLFIQIRLPYAFKDGMQPVCFLTQDSHNEIKVSCCPRIRAPEMQQIHEQKRVRSLQQIEAIFIQTKCTHSRKIPDCNFSIRIPHITRVDSTRYATWILTCLKDCHGDALRLSNTMNNRHVIAFLHFVHG